MFDWARLARKAIALPASFSILLVAAAQPGGASPRIACPRLPNRFAYVSTHGTVVCDGGRGRIVFSGRGASNLRWSPDGTRLRASIGTFGRGQPITRIEYDLRTKRSRERADVGIGESDNVERLRFRRIDPYDTRPVTDVLAPVVLEVRRGARHASYTTVRGGDLAVARIRPDRLGVLFWNEEARSASGFSDQIPLWDLSVDGGARPYGISGFPNRDWLAFSPDGTKLLTVSGRYREVFRDHRLALCDLRRVRCSGWHAAPRAVELDPSWAPDGRRVAFVRAPAATENDRGEGDPGLRWSRRRRLVIVKLRDGHERTIASIGGAVFEPRWISATSLTLVAHDELFEVDLRRGTAVPIAAVAPDVQLYNGEEEGRGGRTAVASTSNSPPRRRTR